jgi:DNA-binding beta-propeller fold protein YncE
MSRIDTLTRGAKSTAPQRFKLPAASTTAVELPFTGLQCPMGVAVDTAGTVYIIDGDNHRALKLAAQ